MGSGFEAIPALLVAGVLSVFVAIAVIRVMWMMFAQEISGLLGVVVMFTLVALTAVSIQSKSQVIAGAYLLTIVTLMVTYPFARDQLESIELKAIDIEAVDRAHLAMSERPDNFNAHFELARGVHRFGLHGHAIAIAENTLKTLSGQVDNVKNMSLRDAFRKEELMVKEWKRMADPKSFRPVKCPACGLMNNPGAVACVGCSRPYLLDLARAIDLRPRYLGRLLLSFVLIAGLILGSAYGGSELTGSMQYLAPGAGFLFVGITLALLFREKKIVGGIKGRQPRPSFLD